MFYGWNRQPPPSRRQQMIDETNDFLTSVMQSGVELPRIPRRRIERGGFTEMLESPGARAAVDHWWSRAFDTVGAVMDRS